MLDTYVINQLSMWAEWRIRRDDGGIGYPKRSAFVRTISTGGFWPADIDSRCTEIDKAVCALIPERKAVVMECYTRVGTKEMKANRCGCSIRTYDSRLDMAHRDVLGFLNDLAAGVVLVVR